MGFMPPQVSARLMLWTGIVLVVVGFVIPSYLLAFLYTLPGADSTISGFGIVVVLLPAMGTLGIGLIAFSLVARVLEARSCLASGAAPGESIQAAEPAVLPKPLAPRLWWTAVTLVIVGVVVLVWFDTWTYALFGSRSLAADVLAVAGPLVKVVALPLGLAFLPASLVVQIIESRPLKPVLRANIRARLEQRASRSNDELK